MWTRPTASQVVGFAGLAAFGLGGLACTPLGGWLYSDPTFALSGVSTKYRGSPADTLQVMLTGCNLNDFDLDGLTVEGQLLVNGTPVGVLSSKSAFLMRLRDSVDVKVPLRIPRADEAPVHAKGDDLVAAQYEMNGRIEISTPIGIRRVVFRQLGDVRFDSAGAPSSWTVRNARPCKPGQSIIPGQSVVPRTLVDTMFRPQPPMVGQPGQVNPF